MRLNTIKPGEGSKKAAKRVGRGIGCGLGKTCGRGQKGAGSRAGYKTRARYEGGQLPLYRKVPGRGFTNAMFKKKYDAINLGDIDALFNDGDVVSVETLSARGFLGGSTYGIKVLSEGTLTKKVRIEAHAMSKKAEEKLQQAKIEYTIL